MVKKYFFVAAVIVATVTGLFSLYESEEEKVKKVFYVISDSIEKKANENPIVGAGKVKKISEVLIDFCSVEIPSRSISRTISSQEISSYAYARRTRFETLSLDFYDIMVEFLDKTTVHATLTVVLKGKLTTGELLEDVHELTSALKKSDDKWRLSKIEIVEILEK